MPTYLEDKFREWSLNKFNSIFFILYLFIWKYVQLKNISENLQLKNKL